MPSVELIEIIFTCERTFFLIVENNTNIGAMKRHMPGKLASCPAGYLRDRDVRRLEWADLKAKRRIEPVLALGIVETTAYEILRPGVVIYSNASKDHAHPASLSSTSGVLVKNAAGDDFLTGPSHEIGKDKTVYQDLGTGPRRLVGKGKAVQEISFTDISLIRLSEEVVFINETFENSFGVAPKFTSLFGEDHDCALDLRFSVYLNSPFFGDMEGTIMARSIKLERSSHPGADRLRYVAYNWAYMGQPDEGEEDKINTPDGRCGSAIWDDEGTVVGVFHYYIASGAWAGFCVSVSAVEVVRAGYKLADATTAGQG